MSFLRFSSLFFLFPVLTFADIIFESFPPANNILPSAQDYATEQLNNAWDMNSSEDIADDVKISDHAYITTPVFSNGVMSTTILDYNGYVGLLPTQFCSANPSGVNGATFPIDTTRYRYLNIRMYSDRPSEMRIAVTTSCNWFENFWSTVKIHTYSGWHTYQIDLQTIAREPLLSAGSNPAWNSVPATGLRIQPSEIANTQIKFDWVTLTAAPPTNSFSLDYDYSPTYQEFYSMFVQDYKYPERGFLKPLRIASESNDPILIDSEGLFPGEYQVVALESNDWPTLVNSPWDMSSSANIVAAYGLNATFSGGSYAGTTTQVGNYFFLNLNDQEIDIDEFRYLRIRMNLSGISSSANLYIYARDTNDNVTNFTNIIVNNGGPTNYDLDLSSWSGDVASIQIALANQVGVNFNLDYISLRNDNFGASGSTANVEVAPWTFKVNHPPKFAILQPDKMGGADYATEVLGNPWNFEDTNDVYLTYSVANPQILPNNFVGGLQGNYYQATSLLGDFDPHQYSIYSNAPSTLIDTSRYKNVVFRLLTDRPQDIVEGSVVRIVWHNEDRAATDFFNGDDIITFDGWDTYVQDMENILLEEGNHPPGSYTNPIWYGKLDGFRVDPHEFSIPTSFYFDFIRLTADDEANTKFAITYDLSDEEEEDVDVNFYYNTTGLTSGGTLIGSRNLANESSVLIWNTSGIPNGTYYIYGVASDAHQSIIAKASGPIVISHSRTQDTSLPILTVDSPVSGDTIYDDFIIRGFALDNIQTASVEVIVDDQLLSRFTPLLFDSRAQDTYKSFAESGNAGFFERVNAISILPGVHTLQVNVYDTGGNVTSTSFSVNKATGNDPDPDTMPPAFNATPLAVTNPIFAQPNLGIQGSLKAKKGLLNLNISDTSTCSSVNLYWGSNKKIINNSPQYLDTFAGGKATVSLSAKKLLPLLNQKQKKIFFKVNCDGFRPSNIVSYRITNIIGTKYVKTHKDWVKKLRRKLVAG